LLQVVFITLLPAVLISANQDQTFAAGFGDATGIGQGISQRGRPFENQFAGIIHLTEDGYRLAAVLGDQNIDVSVLQKIAAHIMLAIMRAASALLRPAS